MILSEIKNNYPLVSISLPSHKSELLLSMWSLYSILIRAVFISTLYCIEVLTLNLFVAEEMGKGNAYIAPDSHFISSVSVLANNLPWKKFKKFFDTKSLVNISSDDHLVLLRLLAMQELLCLNDESLLRWAKHQLYLFGFMQPDYQAKVPVSELLNEFRAELDKQGLLKPFRKQCHKLIESHEHSFPTLALMENTVDKDETVDVTFISANKKPKNIRIEGVQGSRYGAKNSSGLVCSSCGSTNIINLTPAQEASTLPDISFSRCQFCGNTFRN